MIRTGACLAILVNLLRAAPSPPPFLLPDAAEPRRYAIEMTIVPSAATFSGVATIDIELKKRQPVLWLNGKDLAVESATLRFGGRSFLARATASGGEFLRFAFLQPVGPGPAQIEIRYQARLSDRATAGAFRRLAAGDWYAFTTFTAIDARRAFPCFDEPRYKTPWELTLRVPRGQVALSNTHAVSERELPDGVKQVVFAPTRPLPSSQVAFAVGPFEIVDAGRAGMNGVPVRIVTPRGRAVEAAAARNATARILERLEEYTGIAYPFDKIDHLALLDGAFGATEQPGLITYRQRILLARPESDNEGRRRQMVDTMAHELAHQWFGNLVTMSGWEDVWLSEGLATWLGRKSSDGGQQAVVARNRIMASDEAPGARKVRLAMRSREQMKDVYGGVVYHKPAATLDMLENWLGPDVFQRGIRSYLSGRQFGIATTADFVRAVSQAAGRDIGGVVSSFFDRAGVPVITAEVRCGAGSSPRIALRQDRYLPLGAPADARVWRLPVCLKAEGAAARCLVMEGREAEAVLEDAKGCPSWVFPNAGASGYYRSKLGTRLLEALPPGELTAAERLTLAFDVAALVENGSVPVADALNLIPAMAQDTEPRVALEARELAVELAAIVPAALKEKYYRFVRSTFSVPPPATARQVELMRKAQQKSLVEFLRLQP